MKIAVIIPAYRVSEHIKEVIQSIPPIVQYIIVVDDHCPHESGKEAENSNDPRIIVMYHEKNTGVGGAMITGYKKAFELGVDIMIKMDGDGQMDARYMEDLLEPLINNKADYTKANRFKELSSLRKIPKIRLFGNSLLSFFIKLASGYWNIMDPTNGYTAISSKVLQDIDLNTISKGYFYESDMLINFFNMLVPYPGTNDFEKYFKGVPLNNIKWDEFVAIGENCVLKHSVVPAHEIEKLIAKAYLFYYLHPGRLLRLLMHIKTMYELYNYLKAGLSLSGQILQWFKGNREHEKDKHCECQ